MKVSHRFTASSAVFDDEHLVSSAGLVPVMTLAAQTGLPQLLADKICIPGPKIKSGSANPSPKLTTLIAGAATLTHGPDMDRTYGSPVRVVPPTLSTNCSNSDGSESDSTWPHPRVSAGSAGEASGLAAHG